MTIKQLIIELLNCKDLDNKVVINNVLNSPFAVVPIEQIIQENVGTVYIRAKQR